MASKTNENNHFNWVDSIDIASDWKKWNRDVEIRNLAKTFLLGYEKELKSRGVKDNDIAFVMWQLWAKVSWILKKHDVEKIDIKQSFETAKKEVIRDTRAELAWLEQPVLDPIDLATWWPKWMLTAAITSLWIDVILPTEAHAADWLDTLPDDQKGHSKELYTLWFVAALIAVLVLIKKWKMSQAMDVLTKAWKKVWLKFARKWAEKGAAKVESKVMAKVIKATWADDFAAKAIKKIQGIKLFRSLPKLERKAIEKALKARKFDEAQALLKKANIDHEHIFKWLTKILDAEAIAKKTESIGKAVMKSLQKNPKYLWLDQAKKLQVEKYIAEWKFKIVRNLLEKNGIKWKALPKVLKSDKFAKVPHIPKVPQAPAAVPAKPSLRSRLNLKRTPKVASPSLPAFDSQKASQEFAKALKDDPAFKNLSKPLREKVMTSLANWKFKNAEKILRKAWFSDSNNAYKGIKEAIGLSKKPMSMVKKWAIAAWLTAAWWFAWVATYNNLHVEPEVPKTTEAPKAPETATPEQAPAPSPKPENAPKDESVWWGIPDVDDGKWDEEQTPAPSTKPETTPTKPVVPKSKKAKKAPTKPESDTKPVVPPVKPEKSPQEKAEEERRIAQEKAEEERKKREAAAAAEAERIKQEKEAKEAAERKAVQEKFEIEQKTKNLSQDLKNLMDSEYEKLEKIWLGNSFLGFSVWKWSAFWLDNAIESDESWIRLDYDWFIDWRITVDEKWYYVITLDDDEKTVVKWKNLFSTLEWAWDKIKELKAK